MYPMCDSVRARLEKKKSVLVPWRGTVLATLVLDCECDQKRIGITWVPSRQNGLSAVSDTDCGDHSYINRCGSIGITWVS